MARWHVFSSIEIRLRKKWVFFEVSPICRPKYWYSYKRDPYWNWKGVSFSKRIIIGVIVLGFGTLHHQQSFVGKSIWMLPGTEAFPQHDERTEEPAWLFGTPSCRIKHTRWWFPIANTVRSQWPVVSNIFVFHPYLGKIPILTNIFQRGWFNHQLVLKGVFLFVTLPCLFHQHQQRWNCIICPEAFFDLPKTRQEKLEDY